MIDDARRATIEIFCDSLGKAPFILAMDDESVAKALAERERRFAAAVAACDDFRVNLLRIREDARKALTGREPAAYVKLPLEP